MYVHTCIHIYMYKSPRDVSLFRTLEVVSSHKIRAVQGQAYFFPSPDVVNAFIS
jgi:hypothetical protein